MPRYYFNFVAPNETVDDLEGTELSSIDEAKIEAIADARQLMAAARGAGTGISGRRVEITNDVRTYGRVYRSERKCLFASGPAGT